METERPTKPAMTVAIGSDHAGYLLKEEVKACLKELGYACEDFGTHSPKPVDYPDFAHAVADAVARGQYPRGILICGTGLGMAMAANKVAGIRAATCHDVFSAKQSRLHNDANVLTMGGRVIGVGPAREVVQAWLATPFEGGRHARRVEKIGQIEGAYRGSPRGGGGARGQARRRGKAG